MRGGLSPGSSFFLSEGHRYNFRPLLFFMPGALPLVLVRFSRVLRATGLLRGRWEEGQKTRRRWEVETKRTDETETNKSSIRSREKKSDLYSAWKCHNSNEVNIVSI